MGIIQRTQKLTIKQAEAAGAESSNLMNFCSEDRALLDFMHSSLFDRQYARIHSAKAVHGLGAPLVRMKGYESTVGLWMLDDEETGIVFLVWSDGWKKHPWKGTSYEAIVPGDKKSELLNAVKRLYSFLVEAVDANRR